MATQKSMKRKADGDSQPAGKQKMTKVQQNLNDQSENSCDSKVGKDHIKKKMKKKQKEKVNLTNNSCAEVTPTIIEGNIKTLPSNKLKRKKQKRNQSANKPSKAGDTVADCSENNTDTSKTKTADEFLSVRDKKRLTSRQKHKILKLKLRRSGKQSGKNTDNIINTVKETKVPYERVQLPKTAKDISSNWKQLQATLNAGDSAPNKRKYMPKNIRNEKLLKKTDKDKQGESSLETKVEDSTPEIWFDDVDEIFLEKKPVASQQSKPEGPPGEVAAEQNPLVKTDAFKGLTKVVGLDCEMVGVGDGTENMLARVSLVNQYGEQIYDEFVKPKEKVIDYRTHVSGVKPEHLLKGVEFEQVQKDVANILNNRILVGHALKNDFQVLYLTHPKKMIRDTSRYKPFRQLFGGKNPALKKLSEKVLGVAVQEGEHNSIQDAQAAMRLYTMYRQRWEKELKEKKQGGRGKQKKEKAKG